MGVDLDLADVGRRLGVAVGLGTKFDMLPGVESWLREKSSGMLVSAQPMVLPRMSYD